MTRFRDGVDNKASKFRSKKKRDLLIQHHHHNGCKATHEETIKNSAKRIGFLAVCTRLYVLLAIADGTMY